MTNLQLAMSSFEDFEDLLGSFYDERIGNNAPQGAGSSWDTTQALAIESEIRRMCKMALRND
jgi:hypothetical protein